MEIKKFSINSFLSDGINLVDKNKVLSIYLGGTLDIYFNLISLKDSEFIIKKEEIEIYNQFNKLCEEIKTHKLDEKSIDERRAYDSLVSNNKITWYSDNYAYGEGNSVTIIQEEDQIVLSFDFKKKEEVNSIRFRNSGSKYEGFNIHFMNLLNNLNNVSDYYQYTIDDWQNIKTKTR